MYVLFTKLDPDLEHGGESFVLPELLQDEDVCHNRGGAHDLWSGAQCFQPLVSVKVLISSVSGVCPETFLYLRYLVCPSCRRSSPLSLGSVLFNNYPSSPNGLLSLRP